MSTSPLSNKPSFNHDEVNAVEHALEAQKVSVDLIRRVIKALAQAGTTFPKQGAGGGGTGR